MWTDRLLLAAVCVAGAQAACRTSDAKWKGSPKVTAVSSSRPERVLVDWSAAITHPECADSFDVWVWKAGQEKRQGKKTSLTNHQTLKVEVTLEPCVFYTIGVDLSEKDWVNTHHRESLGTQYNSAQLPGLNTSNVLPYFSVGYHRIPRTGQHDLSKAVVRVETAFLTSSFRPACIRGLEVTGRQQAGARAAKTRLSGRSSAWAAPKWERRPGDWEPYGSGRQPAGRGRPAVRRWGSLGGWHGKTETPSRNVTSGLATDWAYPAPRPRPTSGPSPAPALPSARSVFTGQYGSPAGPASTRTAGPASTAPPFKGAQAEVLVTVEPCKEYELSLRVVTPGGDTLLTVPGLLLPALPDIPDYVPPPFHTVLKVSPGGRPGEPALSVQPGSPVPAACLPRYLEAVDAFAWRLEAAANSAEGSARTTEQEMGRGQDLVERTQQQILARQGCVCDSPRLELGGKVFLYQGQHAGRPCYRQDTEGRSLAAPAPAPARGKRAAFIGRVDGGGTTTSRPPWNYGARGGGSAWGSRGSTGGSRVSTGGSRVSTGGSRGSMGGSRPRPSGPEAPTAPALLYWSAADGWLVSPRLGAPLAEAELSSPLPIPDLCPADAPKTWRTKTARTRSGRTFVWTVSPAVTIRCAPDFTP